MGPFSLNSETGGERAVSGALAAEGVGVNDPVSEWLPHQVERRPWIGFLIAIGIVGGLSAYDVVRLEQARHAMPLAPWLTAVLVGLALVPLLVSLVVWVVRHHLSCLTLAAVFLPWVVVFGVSHPRHSGRSVDQAWQVAAVVVADVPVLVGIGVGLWKAQAQGRLWHRAPSEPADVLTPEELEEGHEPAAAEGEESKPLWSDRIDDVRVRWGRNLPLLFALVLASTLVIGVPVGLFSDQGFGNGLVIGALLALAVYGLVLFALTVVALVSMLLELVAWILRRLGRLIRGRAPEQR
jgi:hypothetical protein